MQRTASTADNFGLSMERAAAYVATISSVTRQGASTIGRSLNSILSRYNQIKTTGYNDSDPTKLNQVVSALDQVGVKALDANKQLRPFDEVLNDLAKVYPTLDQNSKAFIATVMAGTFQMNAFTTLITHNENPEDLPSNRFL